MKDGSQMTVGELGNLVLKHLPYGWALSIHFESGWLGMVMDDPAGRRVRPEFDEMELGDLVLRYVNHAREAEGQPPIDFDGRPIPDELQRG